MLSLLTFSACGQSKSDCDKLRNKQSYVSNYQTGEIDSLIALDLKTITPCFDFDSIDEKLMNPQLLTTLINHLAKDKKDVTYGNIVDYIHDSMTTHQYRKDRQYIGFIMKYENRTVNKSDSIEMRDDLKRMEFSDADLTKFFEMFYSEDSSHPTLQDTFIEFLEYKEFGANNKAKVSDSHELRFGHFKQIETLDQLMKPVTSDAPLLVYFTALTDVDSRRMEQMLFTDHNISELLNEFNCYIGFADDKTEISDEQKATFQNKDLETKGQFISEIEKSLFPQGYQPIVLIVNHEFEVVDSFGYDKGKYEFIEFLKRNKDVR